ncbi:MAG: Gfo/Idh/MocA family oxidoreductase [Paracoccaceae bacterium]
MTTQINYGIIGCGMMGQEHLRNIALLDGVQAIAAVEPDAGMRAAALAIAPKLRFVESIADLLALAEVNALLIASPNFCHVGQLEDIARIRPLPVLVEKPLYTHPDDAGRVAELGARYNQLIWVAMEYRYMPPIAAFLNRAQAATGGIKMLTIREHRFPFLPKVGDWNRFNAQTGGTLVEKCCHFFDLMRLTLRAEPTRIMASAGQAVNHLDERYNGETPDIWDNGYVIVDFSNGARAMLELCMFAEGARYQEEIAAIGPLGKIEALVPGPGRFWPAHLGAAPVPKLVLSPRDPSGPQELDIPVDPALLHAGDHNGSTYYQHLHFAQAVRAQTAAQVSLSDGAKAVRMGMAAQDSARSGQAVLL